MRWLAFLYCLVAVISNASGAFGVIGNIESPESRIVTAVENVSIPDYAVKPNYLGPVVCIVDCSTGDRMGFINRNLGIRGYGHSRSSHAVSFSFVDGIERERHPQRGNRPSNGYIDIPSGSLPDVLGIPGYAKARPAFGVTKSDLSYLNIGANLSNPNFAADSICLLCRRNRFLADFASPLHFNKVLADEPYAREPNEVLDKAQAKERQRPISHVLLGLQILIGGLCCIIGSKLFSDALGVDSKITGETGLLYVLLGGFFYALSVFLVLGIPLMYMAQPI